jgi:hypothetical protein
LCFISPHKVSHSFPSYHIFFLLSSRSTFLHSPLPLIYLSFFGFHSSSPFCHTASLSLVFYAYLFWHLHYIFILFVFYSGIGIAQSVQQLATGWSVRWSNSGGIEIFCARQERPLGLPITLHDGWIRRAHQSSRGVLLTVMCRCVWHRKLENKAALAHVGLSRQRNKNARIKHCYSYCYITYFLQERMKKWINIPRKVKTSLAETENTETCKLILQNLMMVCECPTPYFQWLQNTRPSTYLVYRMLVKGPPVSWLHVSVMKEHH